MSDQVLDKFDLVGLAERVRDGDVTPDELLDAVIERIETRNPTVNALIATRIDQARTEIAAGLPDGPLRGVPFAVKDSLCDVAGLPSACGCKLFADTPAPHDGVLATRYRQAGLVLVGKTNTSEFARCPSTEPLLHGPTRNPWQLSHSAGGSSGGSAAAVAAGILPAAHGNDSGGSIRVPAACCGLFGLKPSRGRVPHDNGSGGLTDPLTSSHALTRSVRDSAALLDAVAGPVAGHPFGALPSPPRGSFLAGLHQPVPRLTIGVSSTDGDGVDADSAAVHGVERMAELLSSLGHEVTSGAPHWDPETTTAATATVLVATAWVGADSRLTELKRELSETDVEPFSWLLLQHGKSLTAADLLRALDDVELLGRQVAPFFDHYDIWLSPTMRIPVPRLGVVDTTDPVVASVRGAEMASFTMIGNATGLPAASVPAGFDESGLPVGVQLMGRMGAEDTLLRLAHQIEQAAPWPWQAPFPPA
jgi:amidase